MERKRTISKDLRSPWIFFLLVFILSIPFWLIGPIADPFLQKVIPINLPISALQAINPLITALILVYRDNGSSGIKELLNRTFDYKRIKRKIWYLPVFIIWPITLILAYGLMVIRGTPLPDPQFPILIVPVFFVVFFFFGAGEELGWQGYAIDRLQGRWKALTASIIIGTVWAVWHIIPFMQLHQTPAWILWQCLGMVPSRILIVWLYNNTGKSVFAAIVFHAMSNISQFMFPNYGSHYDPFFAWLILAGIAATVIFLWGPETLARYRYARLSRSDVRA